MRRFANNFHEWRSHEWKSLANRITKLYHALGIMTLFSKSCYDKPDDNELHWIFYIGYGLTWNNIVNKYYVYHWKTLGIMYMPKVISDFIYFLKRLIKNIYCPANSFFFMCIWLINDPDNKVHGAKMGHTWVLSAPDGPHVGLMNLAIWGPTLPFINQRWPTSLVPTICND